MRESIIINSLTALSSAITRISNEWREHKYLEIEVRHKAGKRTLTQNGAMHLFFTQLAAELNAAGYDMRKTLKPEAEIPWTPASVKTHLWRPIQEALTAKKSTTEITTVEPTVIHQTLARHLGDKLGVVCPSWPSKETNER